MKRNLAILLITAVVGSIPYFVFKGNEDMLVYTGCLVFSWSVIVASMFQKQ